MSRKAILITGVSKGIGKALAIHFALQGYDIIGFARDIHAVEALFSRY